MGSAASTPRIAIVLDAQLPVAGYGGTERAAWWLLKGLAERGVPAVLVARPGSTCPYAPVHPIEAPLPDADVVHFFSGTPSDIPDRPVLVTIHGNGQPGEVFLPNTSFVSADHARRHNAEAFVHNGVDPDEYEFRTNKARRLLFLAKASWSVKNVRGALRIARAAKVPLDVVGGRMPWWAWPTGRGGNWHGVVAGKKKAQLLAESSALVFPVLWDEPFGIAVVEALVSGTPVFASPFGSLRELVPTDVGRLCASESEFVEAVRSAGSFSAARCREYAVEKFHYRTMTDGYLGLYERIANGDSINRLIPRALGPFGKRSLPA